MNPRSSLTCVLGKAFSNQDCNGCRLRNDPHITPQNVGCDHLVRKRVSLQNIGSLSQKLGVRKNFSLYGVFRHSCYFMDCAECCIARSMGVSFRLPTNCLPGLLDHSTMLYSFPLDCFISIFPKINGDSFSALGPLGKPFKFRSVVCHCCLLGALSFPKCMDGLHNCSFL